MKSLAKGNILLYSLISGLLLSTTLNEYFFLISFFGFVPLFFIAQSYYNNTIGQFKFFIITFFALLIWNIITTWWVSYASFVGAIMAIVLNALFMAFVFGFPIIMQKKASIKFNLWWIVPFWISYEYLHFNWDLMWPWLTLGNIFAYSPTLIQWYEYTGTSGGTLWILSINILIYQIITNISARKKNTVVLTAILIIPIICSFVIYTFRKNDLASLEKKSPKLNILIVQPNVDPYNEKFYIDPLIQVNSVYQQIENKLSDSLDILLLPETFLTENIYENTSLEIKSAATIQFIYDSILKKYPKLTIISGANSFRFYNSGEKIPATARANRDGNEYDVFNTAFLLYKDSIQIYHKSKLVPGVEKMPFPIIFKPLEKLAINLGGTSGSLGMQEKASLLYVKNKIPVATIICYESIFPDYVSSFFKLGAKTLFIITNDGWWGNTPGHRQHLAFGALRAIENRTFIARSANTGISAVINSLGQIMYPTKYWEKDLILCQIPIIEQHTFYSQFGDIISPIAVMLSGLFILLIVYLRFKK